MRDKIEKLQEQLNQKLRAEIETSAAALKTATELSQLKDHASAQEATIANLRDVNNRDENTITNLTTQLAEAQNHSRLAEKQYNGLKDMIRTLQDENDELKQTNAQLVERVVSEKEKMVDEINKMNDMVETLQKEVDMLRTLHKQEAQRKEGLDLVGNQRSHIGAGGGSSDRRFGATGVFLPTTPKHVIQAHPIEATSVRYDGTGLDLIATGSSDSTVKVWDTNNGQVKATLRGGSGHPMLGVDLSGGLVVGCGADKTCRVWNIRTQRMIHQLAGHSTKVTCVRLLNNEKGVITGSADRSIKVWDISRSTYKQTTTFRHSSTSNCMDVSLDSLTVFSGHMDGGIRLWDVRSGKRVLDVLSMHEGGVTSVQCHPMNGNQILTNGRDSVLRVVDVRTCTAVQSLGHEDFRTAFNYSSCGISPDGAYALAGSGTTGEVFVWGLTDGKVKKKLKAHNVGVGGVAWGRGGSNGQQVATVDRNGVLMLWA